MRVELLVHILLPLLLLTACDREPVPRTDAPTWESVDRADLQVTVTDPQGGAIADAWVTLLPGGRDAATDAEGVATLDGVGQGTFDVLVKADGFQALEMPVEVPESGAATALALEPLDTGATLFGAVRGPTGAPADGATVWVGDTQVATTAADGTFEATGLAPGPSSVEVRGPDDTTLLSWRSEALELIAAGDTEIDVGLAGFGGEGSDYVGSGTCGLCHGEAHARWEQTTHARAGRVPADLAGDATGIDEAFENGRVVPLDPEVPGAFVILGSTGPSDWTAQVTDGSGSTTGALPVDEIYGGHRFGAAFAVDIGGTRAVLPVAWAAAGRGLGDEQFEEGFVPGFVDGWFDGDGDLALEGGQPGDEASFALQCAGCHATGHGLDEDDGFTLVRTASASESRVVGCEACHGPGEEHLDTRSPDDILNPVDLHPARRIDVCARCHERVEPDDHPFSAAPAWPVDSAGDPVGAHERVYDLATPDPTWWVEVPASRVLGDQVGEFRASPHRRGPGGYDGTCGDCHDPHGTAERADLHLEPWDNETCTTCHRSGFPDRDAEVAHAAHEGFAPTLWGIGACTSCHMGRSGEVVRLDAVSGAGELHAHSLEVFRPEQILAEFDAAGVDVLPIGEVPISPCLDCHFQRDAAGGFVGPLGPVNQRITHENMAILFDRLWGAP